MSEHEFKQEYLCEPFKVDAELYKMAETYHDNCEAYDRAVCTGPITNGSIRPADGHQRMLINKHAMAVRREIMIRARDLGYTWGDLHKAIADITQRSRDG